VSVSPPANIEGIVPLALCLRMDRPTEREPSRGPSRARNDQLLTKFTTDFGAVSTAAQLTFDTCTTARPH